MQGYEINRSFSSFRKWNIVRIIRVLSLIKLTLYFLNYYFILIKMFKLSIIPTWFFNIFKSFSNAYCIIHFFIIYFKFFTLIFILFKFLRSIYLFLKLFLYIIIKKHFFGWNIVLNCKIPFFNHSFNDILEFSFFSKMGFLHCFLLK